MVKNLTNITWEEDDLKRNIPLIFLISYLLGTPFTFFLLNLYQPKLTLIFYIFSWFIILIMLIGFSFIIRKYFPSRKYAITNKGLFTKLQNEIHEYKFKDIERLKFTKPFFIQIFMKDGKDWGFVFKRKSINELLYKYNIAK